MTSNKMKAAPRPQPLSDERLDQVSGGLTLNKRVYVEDLDKIKDPDPNPPTSLQYDANPANF